MPTFATPGPIEVVIEVVAGTVRLTAAERADTVVGVAPRDPSRASDVRAAEQARVHFGNGTLTVAAGPRMFGLGGRGAVEVDIALPSGSRVRASSASADIHVDGVLTDCRFSSASGSAHLDVLAGDLRADTASGDVVVGAVDGNVRTSTASGNLTIGRLDGDARFQAASGAITVRRLRGNLSSQTASGPVVVTTAVTGAISARTGSGEVEVGVPEGTAARLDVRTASGTVSNGLATAEGPAHGEDTLVVHARTGSGDILVRRSPSPSAA